MWTCPKCGSKVDAGFDVCWNCGTSRDGTEDPTFLPADDSGPIPDAPAPQQVNLEGGDQADCPRSAEVTGELVPCYQTFSLIEAKFLADQLNGRGIRAVCDDQDMQDNLGGWSGNPRVYCHQGDLDAGSVRLPGGGTRRRRRGTTRWSRGKGILRSHAVRLFCGGGNPLRRLRGER